MLRRPVEQKNPCPNLTYYMKKLAGLTEMHGLRYIVEDRSILEKVFWLFTSLLTLSISLLMIIILYIHYYEQPIYLAPANHHVPIYEIPFPVVTICPESRVHQDVFSYTKALKKIVQKDFLSSEDWTKFQHLFLVCDHEFHENCGNATFNDTEFFTNIDSMKRKLEDLIHGCRYATKLYNCSEIFYPIMTEEGVCYSFNSIDRKYIFKDDIVTFQNYGKVKIQRNDYDMERGYAIVNKDSHYPRRSVITGWDNGLEIILKIEEDLVGTACKSSIFGFRLIVHSQFEMPRANQYYSRISMNEAAIAEVKPTVYETKPAAKNLQDPRRRKCYLQSENQLAFYKAYTFANCHMECLTNYTLNACGCVAYYMPRTKNTPMCGSGQYVCIMHAELKFHNSEAYLRQDAAENAFDEDICNCLPSCSEILHELRMSRSGWNWRKFLRNPEVVEHLLIPNINDKDGMSILKVSYHTDVILKIRRDLAHSLIQMVSSFGGILSLFVGSSLITVVEVAYFCTMRLFCNKHLYGSWLEEINEDPDDEEEQSANDNGDRSPMASEEWIEGVTAQ